jgi:hypothetical protein
MRSSATIGSDGSGVSFGCGKSSSLGLPRAEFFAFPTFGAGATGTGLSKAGRIRPVAAPRIGALSMRSTSLGTTRDESFSRPGQPVFELIESAFECRPFRRTSTLNGFTIWRKIKNHMNSVRLLTLRLPGLQSKLCGQRYILKTYAKLSKLVWLGA